MELGKLNDKQQEIVKHTQGAVLVLAGAGSGKTRVLTHRIAYILENHLAYPSEILAITFTNKAAGEMRSRLDKMGYSSNLIWAQTFHSFGARVLRLEASALQDYTQNFSIYDESDKKLVLKKILKKHNLKDDEYLNILMHDISEYKNQNMSLEQFGFINSFRPNFELNILLMNEYESEMKKNNAFDFDDLLVKTLNLLKNNPEICEKYQKKFKYILIDEFQDTNSVQYELAKVLSEYHKNIFAVGDEDQSIYSWRGANIGNIKSFLKDFENATLFKLEQNYRSTQNILDCANKIIKHNESRIDKTLFTENGKGVQVEYQKKFNDREEAEYVIQTIMQLTRYFGYKYSDFAILTRINALTRSFEDKLLNYSIPYKVFGGLKFYERAEIKTMLAYLKLIINNRDGESFDRIINFPKRNIGEASIGKLKMLADANSLSLFEQVLALKVDDYQDKTLSKFASFKQIMQDFESQSKLLSVSELVKYIIKKLDLESVYHTDKIEDENRMRNLDELVSSIKQFEEENQSATLENYLQSVSLTSDIDTYDSEDNSVVLATVHSAKGLEFKVVFVVGLEDGCFPITRFDGEDDVEEERRLMYVAITRAMERLYLTCAGQRFMYGRTSYCTPSRFLKEMEIIKPFNYYQEKYVESENNYTFGYGSNNSIKKPLSFSFENKINSIKPNSITQNKDLDYNAGDRVIHTKYGEGVVVEYQKSCDMLIVNFEKLGNKVLSAKFAPLKKI